MILRSSINVWPAAMVAEAQDVYHAAMLRTIKQIDATELVTDVIEPQPEESAHGGWWVLPAAFIGGAAWIGAIAWLAGWLA